MVVYTHCIWLATLRVIGCGPDGDELWRLLLGFVPFAVGFAFLLVAIRRSLEVARILRWLAVPFVALMPLAAIPVVSALSASTLGSQPICGDDLAWWHIWWAPVQIVALTIIAWRVYLACRPLDNV